MGIGVQIRRAMEANDKSAADVAKLLGITESAVSQWFAKDSGPRRERLSSLAAALKTSVPWLLSNDPWPSDTIDLAANDTGQEPAEDYPTATYTRELPPPGRPDIPVWASAQAGEDGVIGAYSRPDRLHPPIREDARG